MSRWWHRFGVPTVIVLVIWSLTTHGKFSDSGDEPHYLIIAESLLTDGDFVVGNNYANGDGRWFGADTLEPGRHIAPNANGALWSGHDIGLPILVLPVYAVATRVAAHVPPDWLARFHQTRGLFAYSIVSLSLILLTAWGASLLLSGLRRVAAERYAVATVLALVLSPPVMGHAFLVFPETPAFAVVCAVCWLVCLRDHEVTLKRVMAVALALGLMPWLHRKFSFLSLGLLWLIVMRHRAWFQRLRAGMIAAVGALALVPHAAFHLVTLAVWGHLGGGFMTEHLLLSTSGLQTGALGMLFDRERGLVAYAPIFLIAPALWALTWKTTWRAIVPIALLYLPMAAFVTWGAGFSPPARYLVPVLPLVALAAARGLEATLVRRIAVGLVIVQAAITAYVWQHPRAMWPKELGTNEALARIPVIGPIYERALPSLLTGDAAWWGWIWVGALAMGTALLVVLSKGMKGMQEMKSVTPPHT